MSEMRRRRRKRRDGAIGGEGKEEVQEKDLAKEL